MVGIVIVSHSKNLADSVVEFTGLMAPDGRGHGGRRLRNQLREDSEGH